MSGIVPAMGSGIDSNDKLQLQSMVESAPFPIGVYVGREMRIALVNQSIINVWGKGPEVVGKTYAEVLPELAGTGIYEQLQNVYTTGEPHHANNQRVDLVVDGTLQEFYFKYSFTPLFDAQGAVYGVMNTAADVTDLVLARQQLELAQTSLRGAIDLAQLGTWELDLATRAVSYSENIQSWFGFAEERIAINEVYNPMHPEDREPVETAINRAIAQGPSGIFDAEYRLVHPVTSMERVVHARGVVVSNAEGKPYKLLGTAQDVTAERHRQQDLERLVLERTTELEALNEELAAQNEEYMVVNEELEEANRLLLRSNENLEQFAYAAGHDLQEPLRKIRQFSALLTSHIPGAAGNDARYIERINAAAGRMSTLINDLLEFSNITTGQARIEPVALNAVIDTILLDLDLIIAETNAHVQVERLPVIEGNALQLGQLFRNLLGNALKFRRPGHAPVVLVTYDQVPRTLLPAAANPVRKSEVYHRIQVQDNGIGFDEQYLDRIFQVFQRLHGRSEYEGTGIGLAICEKVVTHHGGALTASSQLGQGATFKIFLPM